MVKVEADAKFEHLVDAQEMSHRASEDLLKVGDVLWPGEHKPN
jgi:ribosomal protein S1